ncbi:MAG: hypothetical protein C5S38_02320 [Candidatus Methanophagaceae archaeon]|nr:MAG: hypothetical protein C5S38_02320 [Methanophagales archaeon]
MNKIRGFNSPILFIMQIMGSEVFIPFAYNSIKKGDIRKKKRKAFIPFTYNSMKEGDKNEKKKSKKK